MREKLLDKAPQRFSFGMCTCW